MTDADLPLVLPAVVGTTLTTPSDIGGAKTTTTITGGAIGELLFAMSANASGGGDKIQRQKLFQANDHDTQDLAEAKMWLANAMAQGTGGAKVTRAQSTSAADGGGKYLRVIGNDASADALDEFPTAGTSMASGSIAMLERWVVTLHDEATDALVAAAGNITIYHDDQVVAIMPAGAYSVNGEIEIGLAATLDDTATFANAGTNPAGITFSAPRTFETGIDVANSGVLTAGSAQGFYLRWTCAEARRASADVEIYPLVRGDES